MSKDKATHLRIIGDCHGKYDQYLHLAKEATYSLCVGDVGFEYSYFQRLLDPEFGKFVGGNHDNYCKKPCGCQNELKAMKEALGPSLFAAGGGPLAGELNALENCEKCEGRGFVFTELSRHFLKDFGVWEVPDFGPIFYVRGAWSIDRDWRVANVSWWEDEELTYQQCVNAIDLYEKIKPEFVVTHTVPELVIPSIPFNKMFGDKIYRNRTEQMLGNMYHIHQPLRWIFGHWHVDWKKWFEHPTTNKKTEFICLKELGYIDFDKKLQGGD
jgi:hypothetical protein